MQITKRRYSKSIEQLLPTVTLTNLNIICTYVRRRQHPIWHQVKKKYGIGMVSNQLLGTLTCLTGQTSPLQLLQLKALYPKDPPLSNTIGANSKDMVIETGQ